MVRRAGRDAAGGIGCALLSSRVLRGARVREAGTNPNVVILHQEAEAHAMHTRTPRPGRWAAIALAAGLAAALGLGATSVGAEPAWDGNGAPPVLVTAPTGTRLGAPARNTIWPCPYVIPIPGTDETGIVGRTVATEITLAETPWVQDGMIDVAKIALVPGAVQLESVFTVTETGTTRRLRGNGIPNHPIGTFPIPQTSDAYAYYAALPAQGYANAAEIPVAPYDLSADLPIDPVMSAEPSCIPALMTGIALTGGAWHVEAAPDSRLNVYDPNAALPTDRCFGHPYATEYHYHGYSWKCMEQGEPGKPSPLLGYALDGFGIYGPRGADGTLVTNAELDECHGRVGWVMFNGTWQEIYHYVLNNEYPYSIGCFRGKPHVPSHMMPGGAMPSEHP